MPRRARHAPGEVVYHVLNRAVARITLFRDERDYLAFERTLVEAQRRVAVPLLAYCIMPNHFHFVVQPKHDGDLSNFMQWLTLTHAQRWRTSHNTVGYGPLYQGRFKAFPIQEDLHFLVVCRYVERNALRAGLVRRAELWPWCSLTKGREQAEGRPVLSDWPVARPQNWVELVNTPQTRQEEAAINLSIYRSRPFGAEGWRQRMAEELGLRSCFRPPGRPREPEQTVPVPV